MCSLFESGGGCDFYALLNGELKATAMEGTPVTFRSPLNEDSIVESLLSDTLPVFMAKGMHELWNCWTLG